MVDHAGILMEQGKSMACERVCGVNDNIEKAHYHSYYEIYYMEAGERHFVINNQPYFARQGDFVLFSPYIMHCAYSGKDIAFKRILICFREHEISSGELREKLSAGTGIYRMDAKSNKRMHFLMEMFMEEQDRAGEYREEYMKSILNTMVLTMLEKSVMSGAEKLKNTDCVSEIMDYINYHYQEDLTLQKLADLLFISPPYLCKIFKEYANQTVVQYINTTRILNAQRMVMETEDRITEISRSVGFVNVTHFNRVFKSITGITPSVFRKRVRMRENK